LIKNDKISISEVIIVEGKDDTRRLKQFFEVDTYETQGSALTDDDLEKIEKLNNIRGVIVFTDPDFSGEKIRKKIVQEIPTVKQAFLRQDEARPKSKTKGKSLGVEHASFESLTEALKDAHQADITFSQIPTKVLAELGLVMSSDGRKRREYLGEKLRIGYVNAKQLPKRLALFAIEEDQVRKTMEDYRG